jgi:hypothetical protein
MRGGTLMNDNMYAIRLAGDDDMDDDFDDDDDDDGGDDSGDGDDNL